MRRLVTACEPDNPLLSGIVGACDLEVAVVELRDGVEVCRDPRIDRFLSAARRLEADRLHHAPRRMNHHSLGVETVHARELAFASGFNFARGNWTWAPLPLRESATINGSAYSTDGGRAETLLPVWLQAADLP